MNKKQKLLLNGLTIIADGLLILQDAEEALDEMTEKEVQQVLKKFEETCTTFNMDEMLETAYKIEAQSNTIVSQLVVKLKLDES